MTRGERIARLLAIEAELRAMGFGLSAHYVAADRRLEQLRDARDAGERMQLQDAEGQAA